MLRPRKDVHLVAVATGPGVTSPSWAIPRPYQPDPGPWVPRVIGSTNPIWIDGDGDGKYTPPRGYAKAVVEKSGAEPARVVAALGEYDEAVAAQAASLLQAAGKDVRDIDVSKAADAVKRGFASYAATLPAR
jgi:hypothetical protein